MNQNAPSTPLSRYVTVRELEVFIHVAECLNFRAAASLCHMSQPTLTRIIQSVESKLHTRLLDRNTRRVSLTPSGHELLPIARRLYQEFNGSLSELTEFISGNKGKVTVGCLPSVGAALMPTAMKIMASRYPGIHAHLEFGAARRLSEMVCSGEIDAAVSIADDSAAPIEFEPLFSDDFVVIGARSDTALLALEDGLDALGVRDYIASGPSSSIRHLVAQLFAQNSARVEPRHVCANISVLGSMVAAGLGISLVPRMALTMMDQQHLQILELKSLQLQRQVGLLTRRDRTLSGATRNFLDVVRASSRQQTQTPARDGTRRRRPGGRDVPM